MDDAVRKLSVTTEQHGETMEGIKSSIDGLTQLITTLNAKYDLLSEKVTSIPSLSPPILPNPHLNQGSIRGFQPKIDFPKFFGEEPEAWVYKCEIFFELNAVEETQKVRLASLHLEDRAMHWFRWYEKSQTLRTWAEFSRVLLQRFGDNVYNDAVGQLTKLKQWSTVKLYQDRFEELATKTTGLGEEFFVSCFVSGLKEEVKAGVQMFRPRTISQAMGLARLQEETLEALAKKGRVYPNSKPSTSYQNPTPKVTDLHPQSRNGEAGGSVKKMTQRDFDEKRAKGLCFGCDEKYYRGHICKKKQLSD